MDPRERLNNPEESLRVLMDSSRSSMWTAIPGVVVSFDASANTVVVQPAVHQALLLQGTTRPMTLLADVPVFFPSGGGVTLTFPVEAGDECLVVFSSRSIDAWWESGAVQPAGSARMHSLSDGFAFVGFRSRPRAVSGVSANSVQLRSDDGLAYVELQPGAGIVKIVAPGGVQIVGGVTVTGGDVVVDGVSVKTHTHPETGTTTGAPNT